VAKVFLAIANGSSDNPDTAWGLMGYANWLHDSKGVLPATLEGRRALAISPHHYIARQNMCQFEEELGHFEAAIDDARKALQDLARSDHGQASEKYLQTSILRAQAYIDSMTGSFDTELAAFDYVVRVGNTSALTSTSARRVQAALGIHDVRRAMQVYKAEDVGNLVSPRGIIDNLWSKMLIEIAREDWAAATADPITVQPLLSQSPGLRDMLPERVVTPLAYAVARAGDLPHARRLIGPTPRDCYPCLAARGRIEIAPLSILCFRPV
jgi:hypothetical protein